MVSSSTSVKSPGRCRRRCCERTWESDTRRRRAGIFVGNEPKGHNCAAGPTHYTLDNVGVSDREETPTASVEPNNDRRQPNGGRVGYIPDITRNGSKTHQISSQQHEKGSNRAETDQHFHDATIALGKGVGEGQNLVFVNVVGQEDTIQNERKPQSNWNDRSIPKGKTVGKIGVSQNGVGINRLRTEGNGHHPQGQRTTRDEKVDRLALDEEVSCDLF